MGFLPTRKVSGNVRQGGSSGLNPPRRVMANPKHSKLPQPEDYRAKMKVKRYKNPATNDQRGWSALS